MKGFRQTGVGRIIDPLLQGRLTPSTVSRLLRELQVECHAWRGRRLLTHYLILYLDAAYFPIMHGGQKGETPLLFALGVDDRGEKEVFSINAAGQESHASWFAQVEDLKHRGIRQVDLVVTDGGSGLVTVVRRAFPSALSQRCLTHKLRNVLSQVPKHGRGEFATALRKIFEQPNREKAIQRARSLGRRYHVIYPGAITSLMRDLDTCLTFYHFPRALWKHIQTNGALESLFRLVRQRMQPFGTFPNEASLLMMVYAIVRGTHFHRLPT
jgi:putative transposase